MSRLGQQVFFARKRSANVAAAKGVHSVRKRSATKRQQQQDVGHEGVITGRDGFSLRSSIRWSPRSRPVSTPINYTHFISFNKCLPLL
ncbi:hypothetical protein [Lysinibacillus xylanilyticus]|uniref:hypothetical protein n=1 Tax=Lysinibacillus xylanilyticus TaxID=582475 RepID=UPI00381438C1